MNRVILFSALVLVLALPLFAACQPPAPVAPEPKAVTPKPAGEGQQRGATWQQRWEETVAEGRKEGAVNLYISANWGAELRQMLGKAVKEKYGIDLSFSPFGGSDLQARINAERSAGLYLADLIGDGVNSFVLMHKPSGLLGKVEEVLILPEVLDPKAWDGGELFTIDRDREMITMLRVINRSVLYNKDLVKEDEINSYKDFLKPQLKGKLTMPDPSQTGPGGWFANHLVDVFGFDEAMNYLRDLFVKQELVIQRDARLHIESVARGKYAVALGGGTQYIADFLAMGAPVAVKVPKEGDGGGASFGAIGVTKKQPHPKATTVFVNWLLTKEGQSLFARGTGNPSRRLDASTEGVVPIFLPLPGEKVAWDTPEFIARRTKVMQAAKEIMAQAQK